MQGGIAERNHFEGWGLSLLLHGLLVSLIWPIVHQFPPLARPEPFRWTVALVESPQEHRMIQSTGDGSLAQGVLGGGESGEQSLASAMQDVSPFTQVPTNESRETVQLATKVAPASTAPPPTVIAATEREAAPPSPVALPTEAAPLMQETLPIQQEAVEPRPPVAATTEAPAEPPASMDAQREQKTPSTLAPSVTEATTTLTQLRALTPVPPAPDPSIAPSQLPSKTDYSWLQRALSRRLEELKRSSRPALEEAGRLKVLVKAVVSNTGELMEAEVVKSSGLARIDQEAMTLVQRAFPMPLDEAIDRPQIVMRIPITYSRD